MNKKAQYTEFVIFWIPKIIAISIVFLMVVFFINRYIMVKLDVQDIEASLVVDRMIYSKNCFSYSEDIAESKRLFPGIIDPEQFSSEKIDSCIFYGLNDEGESKNVYTSAKLTLTYYDDEKEYTKTIYHNKEWYENWFPLVGIRGPGGTLSHKESNYVLVKKDNELLQGRLDFDVILPNS